MTPMTDPKRLECYTTALSFWSYTCYVHWKQLAGDWVYAHLEGYTLGEIGRLMYEYVASGGEIDEVPETRTPWCEEFEFHHDLRLVLPSGRRLYVETVLDTGEKPDDSTILVVNIHDA